MTFFRKVTCAVFTRAAVPHLMGGSAALDGRQCRPCTVTTASFRILTASLSGMSIYTHLTASGRAADASDFLNLCKASPQPSLCGSEVLSAQLSVGAV